MVINKKVELKGVTYYWARHSFANIALNRCRMSKDDVALALNHVDQGNKTTDIYIEKDWSIVDEVQSNVILLLNEIHPKFGMSIGNIETQIKKTEYARLSMKVI